MKLLSLSNSEKKVIIDEEDCNMLSSYRWYLSSGYNGYPLIRSSQKLTNASKLKKIYIHRLIIGATDGQSVDHINGNPLDNRKINLRICSHSDNCKNKKKRSGSKNKYKGVYLRKRGNKTLYQAQLISNGALVYSGYFSDEKAAAIAYDLAAKSWHGEFAYCNILSNGGW